MEWSFMSHLSVVGQLRFCSLISLLLLSSLSVTSALSISDLFIIKPGTTGGGCDGNAADGTPYRTKLDTYYTECVTLINYALATINDYEDNELARVHIEAFFGIAPLPNGLPSDEGAINGVTDYLTAVYNFLTTGTIIDVNQKPFLYCNSDWLELKSWTDNAQDDDGNEYDNDDGQKVTILEEYPNDVQITEIVNGQPVTIQQVPYWSADQNSYIFDISYAGGTYCGAATNKGATITILPARTVTLCPISFQPRTNDGGTPTLGSKTPAVGGALQTFSPQSLTLFHELFHLTLGNDITPDPGQTAAQCLNLVRNGQVDLARMNPENYAQMANAFWYSQQWWGRNGNLRYTFASGVCARIQT